MTAGRPSYGRVSSEMGWVSTWVAVVGRAGVEPATPGLKDVERKCCSILPATLLEHRVRSRWVIYSYM